MPVLASGGRRSSDQEPLLHNLRLPSAENDSIQTKDSLKNQTMITRSDNTQRVQV